MQATTCQKVSVQFPTNSSNVYESGPRLINPLEEPRWDAFVANHPYGWVCHLSRWGSLIERCFKHIRAHFLADFDERGEIVGGLPIYEVRSHLTGNRLVSIPYATLCDPLVDS
jgi:hypothetical protein